MEKKIKIIPRKNDSITEDEIRKLLAMVKLIKYGSVTLVIQDGVIIQMETNEKIRLR